MKRNVSFIRRKHMLTKIKNVKHFFFTNILDESLVIPKLITKQNKQKQQFSYYKIKLVS